MLKTSACKACAYVWVFLLTTWTLVIVHDYLAPYIYSYLPDSASYIEMARSLKLHHWPLVTPWDPSTEPDAIPQALFPPGYPALITLVLLWLPSMPSAAMWVVHGFAVLIPVTFVYLWDGWLSRSALWVLSALMVLSAGYLKMQHLAYSDIPTLWLSLASIGLLVRSLHPSPTTGQVHDHPSLPQPSQLQGLSFLSAGLLAGMAYACRNAALSLLLSVAVWFVYQWYVQARERTLWLQRALWFGMGVAPSVLCLWVYNWVAFHQLQPYTMPVSQRGFLPNLIDLGTALSVDLGVPAELIPGYCSLLIPAIWWFLSLQGYWRMRHQPVAPVLSLALLYVFITELVLWVSRSRFEWGGVIEERHTLSITWVHGWVLALVLYKGAAAIRRRQLITIAALSAIGLLAGFFQLINNWSHWGPQVEVRLHNDRAFLQTLYPIPTNAMVVSNMAPFFRVEMGLPVREWELGGQETDAIQSFRELDRLVAHRPVVMWLVCTSYTSAYEICSDHPERSRLNCMPVREAYPQVFRCLVTSTPTPSASVGDSKKASL